MQRRFQAFSRKRHLLTDIERCGLMIDAESEELHGRLDRARMRECNTAILQGFSAGFCRNRTLKNERLAVCGFYKRRILPSRKPSIHAAPFLIVESPFPLSEAWCASIWGAPMPALKWPHLVTAGNRAMSIFRYYIRRPLDLLRMWHVKIEAWILAQAGIEFVPVQAGLRVVHLQQ